MKGLLFFLSFIIWANSLAQPAVRPRSQTLIQRTIARTPTNQVFLSPNNRYQLRVEDDDAIAATDANDIPYKATMTRLDKEPVQLWTTRFSAVDLRQWLPAEIFISDDGKFAVIPRQQSQWTLLKDSVTYRIPNFGNSSPRPGDKILELDQLADKTIIRIWNRLDEKWAAFEVMSEKTIVPTPDLIKQWNETTREHIHQLFQRAEADAMRVKLREVSQQAAALTRAAIPSLRRGELRQTHFEFLAALRHPDDRAIFNRLLYNKKADPIAPPSVSWDIYRVIYHPANDGYSYLSENSVRFFGDALLARYEGKHTNHLAYGERPATQFYLGKIAGRVRFPTPIRARFCKFRVHLVPGDHAPQTSFSPLDSIEYNAGFIPNTKFDFSDEFSFAFNTVPPGSYMLKAIWDKRPPFTDTNSAGVGDYESQWTGPFTITPGVALTNVFIACDTPSSGGEAYYSADRLAAHQWKVTGELNLPLTDFEIVSAPPALWITSTNFKTSGPSIELTRLVAYKGRTNENSSLKILWRNGPGTLTPMEICLLDQHGCKFLPDAIETLPRFEVATFPILPRSESTWRLVGYSPTAELLFDYTLTNHIRIDPVSLSPQPIPIDLALEEIQMGIEKVHREKIIWFDATYTANGFPTDGWSSADLGFTDIHGNKLQPYQGCRQATALRLNGQIVNGSRSLPFEFTVDPNTLANSKK